MLAEAGRRLERLLAERGHRTVGNTLRPYNEVCNLATLVQWQGFVLLNVHPRAPMRDAANEAYQAATRLLTELNLNRPLYEAFASLDVSKSDPETKYAVWKILRDFRIAGVDRDESTRARLKALKDQIAETGMAFERTINEDVRTVEVSSTEELIGLPQDYLDGHKPDKKGRIRITTRYPDFHPVLEYAQKPELRRRLLKEFYNIGSPKNLDLLKDLLTQRYELARLLGYPDFATYVLQDKMIGSAKAAGEFIEKLDRTVKQQTQDDYALLLQRKRQDLPEATALERWDFEYYVSRVRSELYHFDSQEIRPYLEFQHVKAGLFEVTRQLFGVTYRRVKGVPVWHRSVEVYDVYERRRRLGRFYLDLHPRKGKFTHAMCYAFAPGLRGVQLPLPVLICNFPDPSATRGPTLMQYDDVLTFFHEFGHLLHAIFSGRVRWLKSADTEFDFVEAPSQMLEEWVARPESLHRFARHYRTNAPVPGDLVERLARADAVGRRLWFVIHYTLWAAFCLECHARDPPNLDTTALLEELWTRYWPIPWVEGAHPHCRLGHLNAYSAAYYTYAWSLAIAKDLFSEFTKQASIMDRRTGRRYRKAVLTPGGSRPAVDSIREFLGREMRFGALEVWLKENPTPTTPSNREYGSGQSQSS